MVPVLIALMWVGLLVWLGFFNGLGGTGLLDETEPMFVEAARQMYISGDWLTPMFNGEPRFDKPPLIYWLMAAGFQILGPQPWAARLASALPAAVIVVMLFGSLKWLQRDWATAHLMLRPSAANQSMLYRSPFKPQFKLQSVTPYIGAAIVALNLQMFFFGRLGYSDMLLNLCISGSLMSFFLGYSQPQYPLRQWRWYMMLFVAMGLGTLTKGPVAVGLPSLIITIFLLRLRTWRSVCGQEIPWRSGLLVLVVIALPWYGLMLKTHGWEFVHAFFGFHNVQRFMRVVNQHSGPWYYHFVVLIVGLLPWSVALPAAIVQALRRPLHTKQRSQQLGFFALIWFVVVMGFFTIASTKYLTYSLPALPAAAILIALWWNDALQQQAWGLRLTNYATIGLFAAAAVASFYCPNWLNTDPSMPNLGAAMTQAGLPWVGVELWSIGLFVGCLYIRHSTFWRVKLITAAAFILLFATPAFAVVDQVRQWPLRQVAVTIQQQQQADEVVAMAIGSFGKPSVVFYSQRNVALMRRASELLPYLQALRQQAVPPRSVLLVTTSKTLQKVGLDPSQYQLIKQVGIYQLVRIPLDNNRS